MLCYVSTLDDAYLHFPVVIVPNTTEFLLNRDGRSPELLDRWLEERKPYFKSESALWKTVLHRLTNDYWFGLLKEKYNKIGQLINYANKKGEVPVY